MTEQQECPTCRGIKFLVYKKYHRALATEVSITCAYCGWNYSID